MTRLGLITSYQGQPQPSRPEVSLATPVAQCTATTVLRPFRPVTVEQVTKCIWECPSQSCQSNPIPTVPLKDVLNTIAPLITAVVNVSITK